MDLWDVAAWRGGNGVEPVDSKSCVCNNDLKRVRGCIGYAYSLKAGKAVEEVWVGVLGECVDKPEVNGC